MSESLLPSPADENYKPLSGFALAGLFVSAGFAAMVLLSAAVAVVKGAPIFYPLWFLLLPSAGFVLALVGRNQIVGAESPRAGLRVAHWGLGLALFSGLGYAAYYLAVGMAVTAQANDFLTGEPTLESGYFKHLARGGKSPTEIDIAFLMTKPAAGRVKLRPGDNDEALRYNNEALRSYDQSGPDGGPGELSRFRSMAFVRMLAQAGNEAIVTPQGVRDWSHDKASYKVARNYDVTTPEAVFEIVVQTESTEPENEGQLRQWFVNMNRGQIVSRNLTPLGRTVEELRDRAQRFLEGDFRARIAKSQAFPSVKDADQTKWNVLVPDSPEHLKNGKNVHRSVWQAQARQLFDPKFPFAFVVSSDPTSWPIWRRDDQGRTCMEMPIRFGMPGDGVTPPASGDGRIRVRTTTPIDPAKTSPLPPQIDWEAENFTIDRVRQIRPGP